MKRYKSLYENTKLDFSDLKYESQEEIAYELKDTYNLFNKTEYFWNISDIIEFINNTVNLPKINKRMENTIFLFKQFKNRATSKTAVEKYKKMLSKGIEFDPVIVSGKKFLDGGHRVTAYMEMNKKLIPVIDIKNILKYDWNKEIIKAYE